MKMLQTLWQQPSLQLSTSMALDNGIEYLHQKIMQEETLTKVSSTEIRDYFLKAQKKQYFKGKFPTGYLLKDDPQLLERAIQMAAERHKGEYRDSGFPYLAHVLSTGFILARLGLPREVVLAGILHDSVEDTRNKVKMLNQLHDLLPAVAFYVMSVSGPDIKDAVEKDVILHERISSVSNHTGNPYPQAIKCADGIANLYDIEFMSPKDGRTANERQQLFRQKTRDMIIPFAREVDDKQIIPIEKKKERFLIYEYLADKLDSETEGGS